MYELDKKTKNISFNLHIADNPLLNFVELPSDMKALEYQNILCGVIRGALFTVTIPNQCSSISEERYLSPRTFSKEMTRLSSELKCGRNKSKTMRNDHVVKYL